LEIEGITSIMTHAMGHCIGFRHTDYFDPSVSCTDGIGNYESNDKFSSKAGAEHIPGTPTGASLNSDLSWMLSCTDGGNRPFTNADKVALGWMYIDNC